MEYQVYSKNTIITDSLHDYIDRRVSHIDKLNVDIIACRMDISRDEHHRRGEIFRVEINATVPGSLLRIVEKHNDVRAAIDIASDKLTRQITKFKTKKITTRRKISQVLKNLRRNSDNS